MPGGTTGGPATGGGASPEGPGTSTGPATGAGGGRRKVATGKGTLDVDHWTRWWYAHRANLLDLDTHAARHAAQTGGAAAEDELWRAEAQRVLVRTLGDKDEDLAASAAIALGKSADASDAPSLTAVLGDKQRPLAVRESAALGLAMLGTSSHPSSSAATKALLAVALEEHEPDRLRAMCTWSLGLRRDAAAVPFLLDLVTARSSSWDVPSAATSALGLSGCDLVKDPLVGWLEGDASKRGSESVRRVHAAHALAQLGDPSVVPALRACLRDDDADVRRAAVLALGALAAPEDDLTTSALTTAVDRDRDRGVRDMAAISLGRIAPKSAERTLRRLYDKSDATVQAYAAIGLGLLARKSGIVGLTGDLRRDLVGHGGADVRGAIAIALGLAGDRAAAKPLREILEEKGAPELRAHAALALGMIGDASAADTLRTLLTDAHDPVLQRECAMSLGLLGDAKSVDLMTRMVESGSSLYVQGAAAMALGRIGGASAARTLGAMVGDETQGQLARSFAAVGLGYLLDRTGGAVLGRVGTDLDWYFRTASVEEILSIL